MNGIFSTLKNKFNINLSEQQKIAIQHKDGPCIVLAVPGAGKTTTMVIRLYSLIKYHRVNPQNILTMTFSRASARDMEQRFNTLFSNEFKGILHFSTIHSFSYSVIRNYERKNNIKYILIEGDSSKLSKKSLLKQIYREFNKEYINDDLLDELINDIGFVKNSMINKNEFSKYDFKINNFKEIYEAYEKIKRENYYLDFDDMLTLSLDILKNNKSLLNFYRKQYKYILLDEGQDTSIVQHEIVKLISKPLNNLFAVADDDQSIYGFRGANPKELLEFSKIYPSAKVYFMEESYRSTKNIVSLANEFIKINKKRYHKNLQSSRENGSPVNVISAIDEKWQAVYITEELKSRDNFMGIAVLFRNNMSSILIANELYKSSIPFYMKDSKIYLFNHWVTLDIISFMLLSLYRSDIESFERIYYKMDSYISKSMVSYIKESSSFKSIFQALKNYPGLTDWQIARIQNIDSLFNLLRSKSPKDAIDFIYNDLKYGDYIRKNGVDSGYSIENLEAVIHMLKLIAQDTKSIIQFIDKLNELQEVIQRAALNRGKNAVTLSTIHSSKGLEYDTVYIIDLVDGELPNNESIRLAEWEHNYEPLEEEVRLFYVGITRAKNELNLVVPESKLGQDAVNSRFIDRVKSIIYPKIKSDIQPSLLKKGNIIRHKTFGTGTITSISDEVMEVNFIGRGTKKLLINTVIAEDIIHTVSS